MCQAIKLRTFALKNDHLNSGDMLLSKKIIVIAMAVFMLLSVAQTQDYEVFKGTQLQSFKKSFKDMVEQDIMQEIKVVRSVIRILL